jgi:peroxiredoxin
MMKILISTLFMCFIISLRALDVGEKAPALKVANWLKNGRMVLYPKGEEEREKNKDAIYVVFFFATWSDTTPNVISFVNEQADYLKEINVKFIGISTETEAKIRECMKKYPDIKFHLGMDDKSRTWNDYMEDPAVPMFFIIGSNKKLIWKGSPLEVQSVLLDVIGGTFDSKKQKELESIHSDLSKSVQTFDFDAQLKSANTH